MAQKTNNDTNTATRTEIVDEVDANAATPTLQLRLEQPRDERRVVFHEGVIDNEHMNRKKSKCNLCLLTWLEAMANPFTNILGCCIYKKPLAFGESSSEDDEDCEHCFGHPEKRKKNLKHSHNHDHDHGDGGDGDSCPNSRLPDEPSTSAQAVNPGPPPAEPVEEPVKQSGNS